AHDMGLLELTIFALCTKEVRAYRVPLEELWMEMSELLGLEIQYRERLRAETAQFRTGGYLFYGVLAGSLLVAYPFAKSYMSGTV
ncbi:hypothetical protein, partial [Sulfoacidibacillus ferrooxidans]|uniref:hypothetical protein n=1 Tax=Sulfoacidibacillus ferrooxidans TaxID=2005001 RepID=UPI001F50B97D